MYLKLWFGTWLLVSVSHANAQLHSDNFRHRFAADSLRKQKDDAWFGNEVSPTTKEGLDMGHGKEDLGTEDTAVRNEHNVVNFHGDDTKDSFSDLPYVLRPRPASPSTMTMAKTLAPRSVGKQLVDEDGHEDSSVQVIGAFATLPPPNDHSKSRMRDRHSTREPLRDDFRDRFSASSFARRQPNRGFGQQNTRFFEDVTGHQQPFHLQPDIIHNFNTGSDRRGFDRQNAFLNPNRHVHQEPTVPATSNRHPSNRRHQIHIDNPSRDSQTPRISFFPDLGVKVNRPSLIQPENLFPSSTFGPNILDSSNSFHNVGTRRFDSVNRGTNSVRHPHPSRENQIPLHSTLHDVQRNNRNWPSRTFQDSSSFHNSNPTFSGSSGNTLDRPFSLNENEAPRGYSYGYTVNAPSTGDHKAAFEERDEEGNVKGQYSLLQPDGLFRLVSYEADAENGFRANVRYTPAQADQQ